MHLGLSLHWAEAACAVMPFELEFHKETEICVTIILSGKEKQFDTSLYFLQTVSGCLVEVQVILTGQENAITPSAKKDVPGHTSPPPERN